MTEDSASTNGIVLRPGEGKRLLSPPSRRLPAPLFVKAGAVDTRGAYSVFEQAMAPVALGPGHHIHDCAEEAWYILDGELTFRIGDAITRAGAGTFVLVPRGVAHSYANPGAAPARYLTLFSPPQDRFWEQLTDLVESAPDGQPDRKLLQTLREAQLG